MNLLKLRRFFLLILLFPCSLFSQPGNYYDSLSASSPDFISRLKARIRSPYTQISYDQYDETNVANFASRDTAGGKKVVTCVYSGENYVYTPPFVWDRFSREHTWCYSWMPTWGSETGQEYSDQYHLFPTNQNDVNGIRSNHPLGIVKNVTSTYGGAKFGTNVSGREVYEPRASHKGDAARALLYMCIKYDGIGGNTWNFNWLNSTKLPALNEGPEDLNTLLQWNREDPPDKWEVDRNNYIQSIQKNRNPFVDHPEYVNYINFNDLTLKAPVYAAEPVNQLTDLKTLTGDSSVTLSWTDALPDKQAPSGYLILAYNRNNYVIPVDGTAYNNDTSLTDGFACVNITYQADNIYKFNNLKTATAYYFTVYAYNGTGGEINYKTAGTIPRDSVKTTGSLPTFVRFSSEGAIVARNSGSFNIPVVISNPGLNSPTTAQVYFISGSKSLVGNFQSSTVTFPPASADTQYVSLTIVDDSLSFGTQDLTFGIRNVTGGNSASVGLPGTFTLSLLDVSHVTGGGKEDFTNFPERSQTYKNGSFTGSDGSTWTYVMCSGNSAVQITSPSPVFKKDPAACVTSGLISGGCSSLSFKYMQSFSTNVNLGVYINDSLITTVTSNGEVNAVKNSGTINVNVKGEFTLKFAQMNASSGQVTIDNVVWTGNSTSGVKSDDKAVLPLRAQLAQSYPNPCNPEAIIEYEIAEDCPVSLKVFNLVGMEVSTLVNRLQNAGRYEIKFSGGNLSSGIYLYKLSAGNESITKKLLLLK